jgi:hypothetical protein
LCLRVGVIVVDRKRDQVSLKFRATAAVDPERLARFVSSNKGSQFAPDGTLRFNLKATTSEAIMAQVTEVLNLLSPQPQPTQK